DRMASKRNEVMIDSHPGNVTVARRSRSMAHRHRGRNRSAVALALALAAGACDADEVLVAAPVEAATADASPNRGDTSAPAGGAVGTSPWGPKDEIGRLNLMTDESRAAILSRVAGGKVYDL